MKIKLTSIISGPASCAKNPDLTTIEALFNPAHDEWDDAALMDATKGVIRHAERQDGELCVEVLWRVQTGAERSRIMREYHDYITLEEALHATGQD